MNSGMTQINGGSCSTKNWRNLFNLVIDGKKVVWRTNAQQHPWLQLDLNQDLYVIKVRERDVMKGVISYWDGQIFWGH